MDSDPADAARRPTRLGLDRAARRIERVALWAWAFGAFFTIGLVAALLHRGGLIGDRALIEMQTREVVSTNPPFTGPYSRFGWAHPGPAMFVLLAPLTMVLGSSGTSLMVAAAWLNATAGAAAVWVADRWSRAAASVALLFVAALLTLSDVPVLTDPWNPTLTIVPIMLVLAAIPPASTGDDHAVGIVVVTTLFILSTHAGVGAAVLPMAAFTVVSWWWRRRRWPPIWVRAVVAVLAVPVLADAVVDWPGNAARLAHFALTDDSPQLGLGHAARFVARCASPEFLLRDRYDGLGGILSEQQGTGAIPGLLIVVLLGLAAAGSAPWVRQSAVAILCGFVGALASMANIRGVPFDYLLPFLLPLAAAGWLLAAGEVWTRLMSGRHRIDRWHRNAWWLALPLVLGSLTLSEWARDFRDPETSMLVGQSAAAAERAAAGEPIVFVADLGIPFELIGYFGGVVNELDRSGVDVRVLPGTAEIVGDRRDGDIETQPLLTLSIVPSLDDVVDRGTTVFESAQLREDGTRVRLHLRPPPGP